ncbi:MAG: Gfo/Idh/MocA family oxidoreductase [Candidatus Riflebacteria bacterium]|nr:Gfo/Idh/MocA family oxidoreductase [Candidatus Riflebacteria bacterium]
MSYWLIGSGPMCQEHAKVLSAQKVDFTVIGRGEKSALEFEQKTGKKVIAGGLENFLKSKPPLPDGVIIGVGVEQLKLTTLQALDYGISNVLLEKPGGIDLQEIMDVEAASRNRKAHVLLGYNRRFYSSVLKAREMIQDDDGVTSFNFEFTEWSHEIEKLEKPRKALENWFLANSTHVVDMAFFMGGTPKELKSFTSGSLNWHPASCVFAGSGISENGALFSYSANWNAPGRWGVEMLTKNYRFIFRPLEKLQIQKKGTVAIVEITLDDSLDKDYKPGLYRQAKAFLGKNFSSFCNIEMQTQNCKWYKLISGY